MLLELEEDVEGMQNTILLMQRELKVEKERNSSVERENGRMMCVLRDKPEWMAAVEARQAEAIALAAAERLKVEGHRVNGVGSGVPGLMDVDDDNDSASAAEPMDTITATQQQQQQQNEAISLRTRSGGVVVSDRTTAITQDEDCGGVVEGQNVVGGGDVVVHATNGSNGMNMATRKRTRSSVAVHSVVGGGVGSEDHPEEATMEVMVEENAINCSGKRNRYSTTTTTVGGAGVVAGATTVNSDKSAPRTRGQLQNMMNETNEKLAKLNEVVGEEEGLVENGSGGGDELKLKSSEVLFSSNNNNINNNNNNNHGSSNNNSNKSDGVDKVVVDPVIAGVETVENGGRTLSLDTTTTSSVVDPLKLKLENGSGGGQGAAAGATATEVGGASGGIDLRQDTNASV